MKNVKGEPCSLRVLLVDDSADFLDSAAGFLRGELGIEDVTCVGSGRAALEALRGARFDLVLMDLAMPEMSGLEATRAIKAAPEAPRVVIVTLYDTREYRMAARAVRADGFVAKSELRSALVPVIRELFPGLGHPGGGGVNL